jgi:hypothetical protein
MRLKNWVLCIALGVSVFPTASFAQTDTNYDDLGGIPVSRPYVTFFDRAAKLTYDGHLAEHTIRAVSERRDQTAMVWLFYRLDRGVNRPDLVQSRNAVWVARLVQANGLGELISEQWTETVHCRDLGSSLEALGDLPDISLADGSRDPGLAAGLGHSSVSLSTRRAGMGSTAVSVQVSSGSANALTDATARIQRATGACWGDQRPVASELLSAEAFQPPRRSWLSILGLVH